MLLPETEMHPFFRRFLNYARNWANLTLAHTYLQEHQ